MILEHVIFREILCRAAERKITCSESAVLMRYAETMLYAPPTHSTSKNHRENRDADDSSRER